MPEVGLITVVACGSYFSCISISFHFTELCLQVWNCFTIQFFDPWLAGMLLLGWASSFQNLQNRFCLILFKLSHQVMKRDAPWLKRSQNSASCICLSQAETSTYLQKQNSNLVAGLYCLHKWHPWTSYGKTRSCIDYRKWKGFVTKPTSKTVESMDFLGK